jgi:acetyl esterase/lipase
MRGMVRSSVRPILSPSLPVTKQRVALDALGRVASLPSGTRITETALGDRPADLIEVGSPAAGRATLYLHGGGYTLGSRRTHRALAVHLAAATGAPVYALDYRLAPEDPYPAGLEDCVAAITALFDSGLEPGRIALVGDSAGGGLALATPIHLRDHGAPLPGVLGLISPWADLTLDHLDVVPNDPMLRREWLESCAPAYAGNLDRADPAVSPALADLGGLPPMVVHAGSDEILLSDAETIVKRARAAGVPVDYEFLDGCWHVMHLHAGLVRESTDVVELLAKALARAAALD